MPLPSRRFSLLCTTASVLMLLQGCGGGGNHNGPAAPQASHAQGAYEGTVGTSARFQLLLLENGTYYMLFGTGSGSAFVPQGMVTGTGTETSSSVYAATNTYTPPAPAPSSTIELTADYVADVSFSGTLRIATGGGAGATQSFSGAPISATLYHYSTAAQLADVTGTWAVSVGGITDSTMTVNATGAFSGVDTAGCTYTGTLTPRASGKNVFNLTYQEGAAPCAVPGMSATGIAIVTTPSPSTRQLLMTGANADATDRFVVTGVPTVP